MEKIYQFLEELRPELDFHSSENFIEDGMLDSFDVISLVTELEEAYSITIDGLDILPENFQSIDAILALIRKSGGQI